MSIIASGFAWSLLDHLAACAVLSVKENVSYTELSTELSAVAEHLNCTRDRVANEARKLARLGYVSLRAGKQRPEVYVFPTALSLKFHSDFQDLDEAAIEMVLSRLRGSIAMR